MKKVVTLQFPSITALWLFKGEAQPVFFEMNPRLKLITCECSDKDLERAETFFHATIIAHNNILKRKTETGI